MYVFTGLLRRCLVACQLHTRHLPTSQRGCLVGPVNIKVWLGKCFFLSFFSFLFFGVVAWMLCSLSV